MLDFDPLFLARVQFAFTISFHILFPAFTIGLASFLAIIEWFWIRTKKESYKEIYQFWIKIFAVTFGMGVVSGVVMSYQFGTNWSIFSDKVANVLGPLLGYEVLTAFFLESSFLGIMLFGWNRVSERMHFASTCIVAIGTIISAFWILSANSWMQTPDGFRVGENGILFPVDWLKIIFNPSFSYRFFHMIVASYLTSSFVVGGVSSIYLLRKKHIEHAKIMLKFSIIVAFFLAPVQFMIGDGHGKNTMEYQPAKVASIEGNWEHANNAPLYLFGFPNEEKERIDYGISIPGGASWFLTGDKNGSIPYLKQFPLQDRPPVGVVFWSFRIMVGIGIMMILVAFSSVFSYFRSNLFKNFWLQLLWAMMIPSGFIAILAGWFVTEVGRQPWTAYGVIRTAQSISPGVLGEQVAWSLFSFIVMYTFVFGAGAYYIIKLVIKGISQTLDKDEFYRHGLGSSLVIKNKNQERD
jgi:cytochrome d ubiquinol oxidase subunit I